MAKVPPSDNEVSLQLSGFAKDTDDKDEEKKDEEVMKEEEGEEKDLCANQKHCEEEVVQESTFISKLLEQRGSDVLKEVLLAAALMMEDGHKVVDNIYGLATICYLAMRLPNRQRLIALAKVAKDCHIEVDCIESFSKLQDTKIIAERLKSFLSNQRFENLFVFSLNQLVNNEGSLDSDCFRQLLKLLPAPEPCSGYDDALLQYWAKILSSCRYHSAVVVGIPASLGSNWLLKTSDTTRAAAWLLHETRKKSQHPETIRVRIPATETEYSSVSLLLQNVARSGYEGVLNLNLEHSHSTYTPCDDVVQHLKGARCKLESFTGCLAGVEAVTAVRSSLAGTVRFISLQDPVTEHLQPLDGTGCYLNVTVRHSASLPPGARPLPKTSSGYYSGLTLCAVPAGGGEGAVALIAALAPAEDKKYGCLRLSRCRLSDGELTALQQQLCQAGVRVPCNYGMNQWWSKETHDDGSRDIMLELW